MSKECLSKLLVNWKEELIKTMMLPMTFYYVLTESISRMVVEYVAVISEFQYHQITAFPAFVPSSSSQPTGLDFHGSTSSALSNQLALPSSHTLSVTNSTIPYACYSPLNVTARLSLLTLVVSESFCFASQPILLIVFLLFPLLPA